ncbi:putative cytochrome oxidase subunit IX [Trypanosoma cruzi]|uniref:Cytochrome c oxidase subunit IX, putative n=2 Tax=Trypanosoma cruzi TaxID=5693 RepID=Q4DQJ6_TRYCC|nr:cytochrome c oxidase subunit IX, putative [Trypanosoma cruzi]PBJ76903.1 cytochrome c oxidase subunit IX [Trypanosoma cruzi cruzi]EAN94795.1 cytochrome c oxidase subunit IX, putative [Trypanosoma cruzi]KAF8288047.1 putative cytochrome oxidase subunit IX [Trypanosoma cruzi]KAF8291744.1 putative cytochrome oxidase subunit IX [Trypanosoma cruzi]PBJ76947.1 cytochrome c oxidase subunit IX [Trypanosoma cruzi cruzi]|eukprot:XP_816646.1 cytochrome c oxidase subunit IX [Trypanosoma cruzi strain CL Brener]
MFRSALVTTRRTYLNAFNAKAKARPNFGLRGVGFWTSEVYHKPGQNYWMALCVSGPFLIIGAIMYDGFWAKLDDIAGGGPSHLDYGWRKQDRKPWDFAFDIGEGYAAGPPTLRPAPGAVDLGHH